MAFFAERSGSTERPGEHWELRRTVRDFLEKKCPESEVRRLMDTSTGFDATVWQQLGAQLGLPGIRIPEEFGGVGSGYVDLCITLEEMGAHLFSGPFFASAVLGAEVVLRSGDRAAMTDFLPKIATGEAIATVAFPNGDDPSADIQLTATPTADDHVVSGTAGFALDAQVADVIYVFARIGDELELLAVNADATGVVITPVATMDATRKHAIVSFDATAARIIRTRRGAAQVYRHVVNLACVALANESVGGAQAVLDESVSYAKSRYQFGRPIGSFQAIKHKCADMLVAVEHARSAAYRAAAAIDEKPDDFGVEGAMAKAYVGDVYVRAAADNIQIHGGMGFTWEHPAHLYLKRAKCAQLMFGDSVYHRQVLADTLGL